MKHIKQILLISTCCLLSNVSNAEINLTFDNADFTSSNPTLHTHHTPNVELKPISNSNSGIKLAATCFLPHCSGNESGGFSDNDYGLDEQYLCNDKGYSLNSCLVNQIAQDFCPDSDKYFKSCICIDEFQYTANSCAVEYPNSVLGSEQCSSGGTTYSNSCVCDPEKYEYHHANCGNDGVHQMIGEFCTDSSQTKYSTGCQCYGGYYIFTSDEDCVLSDRYGKNLFQNWVRHPDDFCDGNTSSCTCKETAGACSGYTLDSNTCTGDSTIGESCNNGCQLKWKCTDVCPYKGTLSSCPTGYVCTLEECSSKFYITGCRVGDVDIEKCSWYSCWIKTFSK